MHTLADAQPAGLYRDMSAEATGSARKAMLTSTNGSDESSMSSDWTGYGDESSPSSSNNDNSYHAQQSDGDEQACFPADDHELFTEQGFMSLARMEEWFEQHDTLGVGCGVDGGLQFQPITRDKLHVSQLGSRRLIDLVGGAKVGATGRRHGSHVSISVTDDHELRVSVNGCSTRRWGPASSSRHVREATCRQRCSTLGFLMVWLIDTTAASTASVAISA